jgi:hypothetical protein
MVIYVRGLYLDDIEASIDSYCRTYETMTEDILAGIEEGFEEGLKEGIKKGFVDGLKECLTLGFDNVPVKSLDAIMDDAFGKASDTTIRSTIKRIVSREYRSCIGSAFKKEMEEACAKAAEDIKNARVQLDSSAAEGLKGCVDFSVRNIKDCIGKACDTTRKRLTTDLLFGSLFDGLQDGFNQDLEENIKACKEKLDREIDGKVVHTV